MSKRDPDRCACGSEVLPRRLDFVWRVDTGEHWRHSCGPAGTIVPPKRRQVRGTESRPGRGRKP